ncbi:M20 family metallo-hydrolase [Bacteroidota bacterium]
MIISTEKITDLLSKLIRLPSPSGEEDKAVKILTSFFKSKKIKLKRIGNNLLVKNLHFNKSLPTLLLNSHIDTVKPSADWKNDPYDPVIKGGKLYGLGSNDAGGGLVGLIAAFLHFYDQEDLSYNIILAVTSEEEISGSGGIESILASLKNVNLAMVGEPTGMEMAIAEKGLMVLDCYTYGKSGHAARNDGENAISKALPDVEWFNNFEFPLQSPILGPVKMSVTVIEAGTQHNVVPDECHFIVDIRTTDAYKNEETLDIIRRYVKCEVKPRSTRLQPSGIEADHPIIGIAGSMGINTFGSPTLSDQALMPFPSVKIGPGDSTRSHTPDEFIMLEEIEEGIKIYISLIDGILKKAIDNTELITNH